jgi:hypothetical protein
MRVKRVLRSYVGGVQMGDGEAAVTPSGHQLTADLEEVSRTNQMYFQICFGTLLIFFTASCGLVVKFMNDPGRLGTLFALTGIAIAGLVIEMVSLWKQKVTADVLALLTRNLQPGDLRGVIEILFAKL